MSTKYSEVFSVFLGKIKEYNYIDLDEDDVENEIMSYLNLSCSKFDEVCKKDLFDRDEENLCFNDTLTFREIDIITDGMVCYWLKPYVYCSDNLSNILSSKDFSLYSPANLLKEIKGVYTDITIDFEQNIKDYSYTFGDIGGLHI